MQPTKTAPHGQGRSRSTLALATEMLALEPRMLFDGAAAASVDVLHGEAATHGGADATSDAALADLAGGPSGGDSFLDAVASAPARELVVVDSSIEGWQTLVEGLPGNAELLVLDPARDGIAQIREAMDDAGGYSALHVVSHGQQGGFVLGGQLIDAGALSQYASDLSAIGQSLTADGDILLYGCDIADQSTGQAFLAALAGATGADVAASTDATGAAGLGGDWDLEASVGAIEASVAIGAQAQQEWGGALFAGIPEITVIETSEPATADAPTTTVAVGEIVRYRLVFGVAEGVSTAAEVSTNLPDGIRFVNDGTATVGFVANGGGTGIDSTTLSGAGLDITGGGIATGDILDRPVFVLPSAAIVDGGGTPVPLEPTAGYVMASGADPRFLLGDLNNTDSDGDNEFVVIEFNAIVENQASNQQGVTLLASYDTRSSGVVQGTSNSVDVTVGEPSIVDVDKHVVTVSGNQVTFEVTFSNSGPETAHNVRLVDDFAGAVNISFNGSGGISGLPGGAVDNSDADTLDIDIPTLASGGTVTIQYTATVGDPAQAVPSRDAVVTYTSLSPGGELLNVSTVDGGGAPSADMTLTTGERTGDTGDYGGVVNDYIDSDGAGMSVVAGTVWDDTLINNQSIDGAPAENRLAGVTVTLTWAGPDTVFGSLDDHTGTTTTNASGVFAFGPLPSGPIRLSVPVTLTDPSSGPVAVAFDRGGAGPLDDGLIEFTLGEGEVRLTEDFGFVKQNAAPTIAAPGAQTVGEGASLAFTGGNALTVGDPDLAEGFNPAVVNHQVSLGVSNGTLSMTGAGTVIITGNGTSSVQLTGTIADINATLATLAYQGNAAFVGADTLTVRIDDQGGVGDADGDGIPGEVVDDNLFATAAVGITVNANNVPVANPDTRTTDEATSVSGNAVTPSGAQQAAGDVTDTDADLPADTLQVVGATAGSVAGPITGGSGVGVALTGTYGQLVLQADGSYVYTPGAAANALAAGQTVQDVFTYTIRDNLSATSTTTITITINGQNDPPVANPDLNSAPADGSVPATGGAVTGASAGDQADTDPDAGDTLTVQGVQAGTSAGPVAGGVGVPVAGTYGSLVLNPDGSYTYNVDTAHPSVAALGAGQSVNDVFTYTIGDGHGGTSSTTLTISIDGSTPPAPTPTPAPPPAPTPTPAPAPVPPPPPAPGPAPHPAPAPMPDPKDPKRLLPPNPEPKSPYSRPLPPPLSIPELDPISPLALKSALPALELEKTRQAAVKSAAAGGRPAVAASDDCEPTQKLPPRAKAVKRSVAADLGGKRPANFSDQIKQQVHRHKPPVRLKPRTVPGRVC